MFVNFLSTYALFFKDFFDLCSFLFNDHIILATIFSIPLFYILCQFIFIGNINIKRNFKNYLYISINNIILTSLVFIFTESFVVMHIVLSIIFGLYALKYFIFSKIGIRGFFAVFPFKTYEKNKDDREDMELSTADLIALRII